MSCLNNTDGVRAIVHTSLIHEELQEQGKFVARPCSSGRSPPNTFIDPRRGPEPSSDTLRESGPDILTICVMNADRQTGSGYHSRIESSCHRLDAWIRLQSVQSLQTDDSGEVAIEATSDIEGCSVDEKEMMN